MSGDLYIYSFLTDGWTYLKDPGAGSQNNKTNMITRNNGDVILHFDEYNTRRYRGEPEVGVSGNYEWATKDLDFGAPGVRKKIYKVYITYKGTHTTNGTTDKTPEVLPLVKIKNDKGKEYEVLEFLEEIQKLQIRTSQ